MSIPLNTNELLQLLNKHRLHPTLEKESQQVFITMKIEKMEIPLFFVIYGEKTLLQLIAYFPFPLTESRMAPMARLLHKFNRDIDLPGFGLDEKEKLVFYRLVIPCLNNLLDEQLLANFLGAARLACESFLTPIGLVATGNVKDEP